MRKFFAVALSACLGAVAGCAGSDHVYGNIYEGLKARDAIVHPSIETGPAGESMSYQEYETERKALLERSNQK